MNLRFIVSATDSMGFGWEEECYSQEEADQIKEDLLIDGYKNIKIRTVRE